jgi:carbamoyl-phosphate synthase large subunit
MKSDLITVLVTAIGGFSHGSSIVKALLESSLNLKIIGTDMSPRMLETSPLDLKEILPRADASEFISELARVAQKHEVDCIFTGSEPELIRLCENLDEFRKQSEARPIINNPATIKLCKNKYLCMKKLGELGFSVPQTTLICKIEDLEKVQLLPLVLKPNEDSGASANVFLIQEQKELECIATYLLGKGLSLVAQAYLPFNENEFTVGVTTQLTESTLMGSIVLKKFMEGPTRLFSAGEMVLSSGITQGEFGIFPEVQKACEEIACALGSTGPLNIQLRKVGDEIMPFEVNPRFSGTTSARAFHGYNEPEFFIREIFLQDSQSRDSLKADGVGWMVKGLHEHYYAGRPTKIR